MCGGNLYEVLYGQQNKNSEFVGSHDKDAEDYPVVQYQQAPTTKQFGPGRARAPQAEAAPAEELKIQGGPSQAIKAKVDEDPYQRPKSQMKDLKGDQQLVDKRKKKGSSISGASGINY